MGGGGMFLFDFYLCKLLGVLKVRMLFEDWDLLRFRGLEYFNGLCLLMLWTFFAFL